MTGEPRPRYNALQLLGESGACGSGREWYETVKSRYTTTQMTLNALQWFGYNIARFEIHKKAPSPALIGEI